MRLLCTFSRNRPELPFALRSRARGRASLSSRARGRASTTALTLLLATGLAACGAGSSLDDYQDGVPDVVPSPIKSTGDGGVGASCTSGSNCEGDGTECLSSLSLGVTINLPAGYCTQSCQRSAQCPTGSACLTGGVNTCLKTCTASSECRESDGYACATIRDGVSPSAAQKYCLPGNIGGGQAGGGGTTGGVLGGLLGGAGGTTGGFIGGGGTGGFLAGTTGGTGGFVAGAGAGTGAASRAGLSGGGTPGGSGSGDAMGL